MEQIVRDYVENQGNKNFFTMFVWYSKTLQHHKAVIVTDLKDEMYYEVTYNGIENEFYLDAYGKVENRKIIL